MNRRNFILGLGTAATLSGAASVTGATLSNEVSATSNFSVIAEEDLTIRRNSDITTASDGSIDNSSSDDYVNTTVDYVSSEGQLDFTSDSERRGVSSPQLTVNDQEDGSLEIAVATPNEAGVTFDSSSGGTLAPLEIENTGGTDKTVAADYTYNSTNVTNSGGSNTRGDGNLDSGDVATLFQFSIGGTQISPSSGQPDSTGATAGNTATVDAGTTVDVDFSINFSQDIVDDISDNSGGSYSFSSGNAEDVQLLDQISFGGDGT
jgi:hypothetical protein